MKKRVLSWSAALVVACLLLLPFFAVPLSAAALSADEAEAGAYLDEWALIALLRGQETPDAGSYPAKAALFLDGSVPDTAQITEVDRMILTLTAAGYDASSFGGVDLTDALADFDRVIKQGVNGAVWALLALDCGDYRLDDGLRERLVSYLLGKALVGGGWAFSGTVPDPDMTAMALTALAPYREDSPEIDAAVHEGLSALSQLQTGNGGFVSYGIENAESAAQVIIALTSLGLDPSDGAYCRDGKSALDALASFSDGAGGYCHSVGGGTNLLATVEGALAETAYRRFRNRASPLYRMTDTPRVSPDSFSEADRLAAAALPEIGSAAGTPEADRLLGRLLLASDREDYAELEAYLRSIRNSGIAAGKRVSELDAEIFALSPVSRLRLSDKATVEALTARVDALSAADRACLTALGDLEAARSVIAVRERKRVLLIATGAGALGLAGAAVLFGVLHRHRKRRESDPAFWNIPPSDPML